MRHSFAVGTVVRWYREGVDVDPRMPALSTYLGHRHVSDTYWYLSSVPELLRLAAARLDRSLGGISHDDVG
jgi:integrase